MKSKQDNDVIDGIGAVYVEIKTKLSYLIGHNAVYHETRLEKNMIDRTSVIFVEYNIELLRLIK